MIVTCERCATQFQLDDERVPAGGARVRCSRCKHAFSVLPPARSEAERVDRAAAQGLEAGRTPEPTRDLLDDDLPDRDLFADHIPGDSLSDDSDWEFEDDALPGADDDPDPGVDDEPVPDLAVADEPVPDLAAADEPVPGLAPTDPEPSAPTASGSDAAEELGSPADWDIFDDPEPAPPPAAPSPAARAAPERRKRARAPVVTPTHPAHPDRPLHVWGRRAGRALGWLAAVGLFLVGAYTGLTPPGPPALSPVLTKDGLAVESVRARWVENANLGPVFVVSGRIRNPGAVAAALPALALLDAAGQTLAEPVALGAPRSPWSLRNGTGRQLRADPSRSAWPLGRGESRVFEAVVWPLPPAAERYAFRAAPGPTESDSRPDR